MGRMLEKNYTEFLSELASAAPVPGGGGASAAVGALAAALGSMVANLTVGKKKYAQYEDDMQRILSESQVLMRELTEAADEDAKAFEPLSKAYGLPRETEEERAYKEKVMAEALYTASLAPLHIMEKVSAVIGILEETAQKGSRIAVSDAGVGAAFAQAALRGASLNVFINTKLMKDREQAECLNRKAREMIADGISRTEAILALVSEQVGQPASLLQR